jgi:hypothetical protein
MGGAKLLVDKTDYAKASTLLIEGGFMLPNDTPQTAEITDFLGKLGAVIPGVHLLSKELRVVLTAFILISLPIALAFFFILF